MEACHQGGILAFPGEGHHTDLKAKENGNVNQKSCQMEYGTFTRFRR